MDLATLQAWLLEAQTAYHNLMTGSGLVHIRHNEREMSYQPADRAKLAAYIADLQGQIARLQSGRPLTIGRGRARPVLF